MLNQTDWDAVGEEESRIEVGVTARGARESSRKPPLRWDDPVGRLSFQDIPEAFYGWMPA